MPHRPPSPDSLSHGPKTSSAPPTVSPQPTIGSLTPALPTLEVQRIGVQERSKRTPVARTIYA